MKAKTKLPEVPLRGPHALPSPADWEDFERRILEGEDPQLAANARGLTLSNYRRQDERRQRALLRLSREARADEADRRLEVWASRAEASDQLKIYFHRYHTLNAGRGVDRLELEVSSDVADAIDRFTQAVAAAAVRGVEPGGAAGAAGGVEPGGEGGARLALARLAGEAEPGRP